MNKQDELQRAVQPDGEEMIKKRYHKPVLNQYEDLRTVTLGSSPGAQESGSLGPYKRVGFDPPPPPPNPGAPAGSSDADANIFGGS